MNLIVAEKSSTHGLLLVITDKDILGKKFEEGRRQLDLSQQFYQGTEETVDMVKSLLEKARHIHATGKLAVAILVESDLVLPSRIFYVQGIPHAEVVMGG